VIAIIAILAAILFPVFARAREKARQSSCLSNCKQISLAVLMYTQDYDEALPFLYVSISPSSDRTGLAQIVQPYIKNANVHNCPSSDGTVTEPISYLEHASYGYHTGLFTAGAPPAKRKLSQIKRPAEIFMMGDVMQDRMRPDADTRRPLAPSSATMTARTANSAAVATTGSSMTAARFTHGSVRASTSSSATTTPATPLSWTGTQKL
jgi:type II secretory pathway pseudopilin PulG